ncbi:hypothetical protein [Kribbella sp. NPDC004536]|uniref:hypothetical protein n=1 Tax=Kribbella sp. NPDC004536 TaxID=3364106 RepID=UPI0036ACDA40
MIDISGSIAKHTVTFDDEFTGQQILDAVKAACERSGDEYHEDMRYDDGYVVTAGRAAIQLHRSLAVVADKVTPYLEPTKGYSSVALIHHELSEERRIEVRDFSAEMAVDALHEFEQDLKQELRTQTAVDQDRARDRHAAVVIDVSAERVAVRFDRPATGRDLMAAVEATCTDTDYGTKYYEAAVNGGSQYVVGQSSGLQHKSLVVVPDSGVGDGLIDLDEVYRGATVANHQLPVNGQVYPSRPELQDEVDVVNQFAEKLKQNVSQLQAAAVGLDRGARGQGTVRTGSAGEAERRSGAERPGTNLAR